MGENTRMKDKLIVCIMGQDCLKFIDMAYKSVKGADAIVFCDGGSSDGTIEYLEKQGFKWEPEAKGTKTMIFQPFDKLDETMNGRQRNFYLEYIKKKYPESWCLCIDADEVVQDIETLKKAIKEAPSAVYGVHMRHFIGDLGHEDSTVNKHYVPNRLFKVEAAGKYPEVEHSVLESKTGYGYGKVDATTIWHLAYVPNLEQIKDRYEQHKIKSKMHSPKFLEWWYKAHIFGKYPRTAINPVEIPNIILEKYGIDKDELYFEGRGLETKHFIDARQWKEHFNCKTAAEWGCGLGPRVYAMNTVGIKAHGWELSKYAVNNKIDPNITQADITKHRQINKVALVIAYDLLEHIPYDKLDKAIDNLIASSKKHLLVSVPVIGDPNLEADPTHIIKETKDWWTRQFTNKGLILETTPKNFLFREQLMIFRKGKNAK